MNEQDESPEVITVEEMDNDDTQTPELMEKEDNDLEEETSRHPQRERIKQQPTNVSWEDTQGQRCDTSNMFQDAEVKELECDNDEARGNCKLHTTQHQPRRKSQRTLQLILGINQETQQGCQSTVFLRILWTEERNSHVW